MYKYDIEIKNIKSIKNYIPQAQKRIKSSNKNKEIKLPGYTYDRFQYNVMLTDDILFNRCFGYMRRKEQSLLRDIRTLGYGISTYMGLYLSHIIVSV